MPMALENSKAIRYTGVINNKNLNVDGRAKVWWIGGFFLLRSLPKFFSNYALRTFFEGV